MRHQSSSYSEIPVHRHQLRSVVPRKIMSLLPCHQASAQRIHPRLQRCDLPSRSFESRVRSSNTSYPAPSSCVSSPRTRRPSSDFALWLMKIFGFGTKFSSLQSTLHFADASAASSQRCRLILTGYLCLGSSMFFANWANQSRTDDGEVSGQIALANMPRATCTPSWR